MGKKKTLNDEAKRNREAIKRIDESPSIMFHPYSPQPVTYYQPQSYHNGKTVASNTLKGVDFISLSQPVYVLSNDTPISGLEIALSGPDKIPNLTLGNDLNFPYNRLITTEELMKIREAVVNWYKYKLPPKDAHTMSYPNRKLAILTTVNERNNSLGKFKVTQTAVESIGYQLWAFLPSFGLDECIIQPVKEPKSEDDIKIQRLTDEEIRKEVIKRSKEEFANINHDFYHDCYKTLTAAIQTKLPVNDNHIHTGARHGRVTMDFYSTCTPKTDAWFMDSNNDVIDIRRDYDIFSSNLIQTLFKGNMTDEAFRKEYKGVFIVKKITRAGRLMQMNNTRTSIVDYYTNSGNPHKGNDNVYDATMNQIHRTYKNNFHTGEYFEDVYMVTFVHEDKFKTNPIFVASLGLLIGQGPIDYNTVNPYSKAGYVRNTTSGWTQKFVINSHEPNKKFWTICNQQVVEIKPIYDISRPEFGLYTIEVNGEIILSKEFKIDNEESLKSVGIYPNKITVEHVINHKIAELNLAKGKLELENNKLKQEKEKLEEERLLAQKKVEFYEKKYGHEEKKMEHEKAENQRDREYTHKKQKTEFWSGIGKAIAGAVAAIATIATAVFGIMKLFAK